MTGNVLNGRKGPSEAARYIYAKFGSPGIAFRAKSHTKFVDSAGVTPTTQSSMQLSPTPVAKNGEYSGFVESTTQDTPSMSMYPFGYSRYWTGKIDNEWASVYAAFSYRGSFYDAIYYEGKAVYRAYAPDELILAVSLVLRVVEGKKRILIRFVCTTSSNSYGNATLAPDSSGASLYAKEYDTIDKTTTVVWRGSTTSIRRSYGWGSSITSISPDGKKLACVCNYYLPGFYSTPGGIVIVDMETGEIAEVKLSTYGSLHKVWHNPQNTTISEGNNTANSSVTTTWSGYSSGALTSAPTLYYACQYDDDGTLLYVLLGSTAGLSSASSTESTNVTTSESVSTVGENSSYLWKKDTESHTATSTWAAHTASETILEFFGVDIVLQSSQADGAYNAHSTRYMVHEEEWITVGNSTTRNQLVWFDTTEAAGQRTSNDSFVGLIVVCMDLRAKTAVFLRRRITQQSDTSWTRNINDGDAYITKSSSGGYQEYYSTVTVMQDVMYQTEEYASDLNASYSNTSSTTVDDPTVAVARIDLVMYSYSFTGYNLNSYRGHLEEDSAYTYVLFSGYGQFPTLSYAGNVGHTSSLAWLCRVASMGGASFVSCPVFTGEEYLAMNGYMNNPPYTLSWWPYGGTVTALFRVKVFATRNTGYNGEVPAEAYAGGVDSELNFPVASITSVSSVYLV